MSDTRPEDSRKIQAAYADVERALRRVGKLLRTTYAGKFMWSSDHKAAVSGLRVVVEKLRYSVPRYEGVYDGEERKP